MKNITKRICTLLLTVVFSILSVNSLFEKQDISIVYADNYEYAWFPLTYMDVYQVCFENASHQGSYHIDCNSGTGSDGWVHAPFTGKIVAYTTNYSCALFQSIDKVHYADGTLDYMTMCLEHGSNISELQNYYNNGTVIKQGEAFYKAGGVGAGGKTEFGVHFDFGICRGKQNAIQALTPYTKSKGWPYSGCGNMYPFEALFINRDFTKGVGTNRGYGRNVNGSLIGVPSGVTQYDNYNGLWKDLNAPPPIWYESLTPANLGDSFDAIILNTKAWKPIRPDSSSNIVLYAEEWTTSEMWRFTRQSNGSYKIQNFGTGNCLDAANWGTADGTNVGSCASNDTTAQRWFIYAVNGGYAFRPSYGDLAMDLNGNNSDDNTNIHLWTYHGGDAQIFSIYRYNATKKADVNDYAKPSPAAPTLSVKSHTSIALSWSATAYTEKYIVYRSTDNSNWTKLKEVTSTSYTDTGLSANTKYYYKYEAINRFYTVSSPSASATTNPTPKYTVIFNSNGGSGTMSYQEITRDQSTVLRANEFKKTGYTFLGWSTDKSATKVTYTDKQAVNNIASAGGTVTLYAIWKANNFTIKFNANGGSGTMGDQVMTYDQASKLTKNAFTKTGYSFESWSDGKEPRTYYSDQQSVKNLATSGTVTLWVKWKANTYKVTLDDGSGKTSTINVTYDGKYSNLPDPEKSGYNFTGWYTEAGNKGTLVSNDTVVKITADQTLYAHWDKEKIRITFNANGGTSEMSQKLVSYDTKYGVLPGAEKTGYEFSGWYLDEALTKQITEESIVKITKNQEVYAKWTQKKLTITFDANGGTVEMESKKVVSGKVYGVLPEAEKEGYELVGWFTKDGTEITSESIVDLDEDTVVNAKWRLQGDVDADGDVDVDDVIMLQQWLLAVPDATLNDWRAGDLCKDERIDVFDLCLLKRMLLERNGGNE